MGVPFRQHPRDLRTRVPALASSAQATNARHAHLAAIDDALSYTPPVWTFGLVCLLVAVFGVEKRLAFEIDAKGHFSLDSLIVFGAAGYDRVVGSGEYWRLFLAPLLHGSVSHLVGNCIALVCVGLRLEPLLGWSRFTAIFALGAAGGLVGSLVGNPHAVVTVGASGAITALIGALFTASFGERAERHDSRAMRIMALRFGVPALAPLIFGASGHTDYHAHLGSAITGVAAVLALSHTWGDLPNRLGGRIATLVSLACLAGTFASAALAYHSFSAFGVPRDLSAPAVVNPSDTEDVIHAAPTPEDPMPRITRALTLIKDRKLFAAEMELDSAIALTDHVARFAGKRELARTLLAIVVADEGRRWEARSYVNDICHGAGRRQSLEALREAKICD